MAKDTEKGNFEKKAHQLYLDHLPTWIALLKENKGVWRSNFRQTALISLISLATQPFQMLENALYAKKIKNTSFEEQPPVFILGHWRSGTTHLHYFLTRDPQFGYLTYYQSFFPNVALIGGDWFKYILKPLMPKKRPMDNVTMSLDLPNEDDPPMATFTKHCAANGFFFPRNESYFEKYNLFRGISPSEKKGWQEGFQKMMAKISIACGGNKQIVLKSPPNTGRIKELLELYPNAKFVYIHRNPYRVYASTYRLYKTVTSSQFLQDFTNKEIKEKIFYYYETIIQKYLDERDLIPKGNLIEIAYDDLENKPLEMMKETYDTLGFEGYEAALPKFEAYLNGIGAYKKNTFSLDKQTIDTIRKRWKMGLDEWNYDLPDNLVPS